MTEGGAHLTVVGDDDQTIYALAGLYGPQHPDR